MAAKRIKDMTPDELMARMAQQGARKSDQSYDWTLGLQTVKNARAQIRRITGMDNDQVKAWAVSGLPYDEYAQGGPEAGPEAPVVTESQEEATTGPSRAVIDTAVAQLKTEMESPEFAAALEEVMTIADDHPIKVKLDAEIAELQSKVERIDADLIQVQADYDKAWAKESKSGFENVSPAVTAESDRCSRQIMALLEQRKSAAQKLDQLRNPAELERRMQDVDASARQIERIKTMADKKAPKQTARDLGTPEVYLSESGNFRPGMDARYKSDLVNSALGIKDKKALMTFEVKDALERLQVRNWVGFLTRKREIIEAKAAKAEKAKASKAKAGISKVRAAAKKREAKKVDGEVKPDPKPAPAAKRRGGRLQSKAGAVS